MPPNIPGPPGPAALPSKREPLFAADFLRVLGSAHLFFLCFHGMITTIPLYVAADYKWQVGMVAGTTSVTSLLARPLAGYGVDRWGRRPFILLSSLLAALALAGYAISPEPYALLPWRALHGLALSLFTTSNGALGFDLAPAQRRGEAAGYVTLASNAVILYGPLVASIVAGRAGYGAFFLATALVSLLIVPLALGLPREEGRAGEGPFGRRPDRAAAAGPTKLRAFSRRALPPSLAFLAIAMSWGVMQAFLALLARERGLGNPGLFFLAVGVMMVVSRPFLGVGVDRFGRVAVAVPGLAAVGVALLLVAMAGGQTAFVAVGALYGLGFSAAQVGLITLAVDRAGMAERGLAVATFGIAFDGGALLGSTGLGPLADSAGLGAVFLVSGSAALLGAGLAPLVRRAPPPQAG